MLLCILVATHDSVECRLGVVTHYRAPAGSHRDARVFSIPRETKKSSESSAGSDDGTLFTYIAGRGLDDQCA